MNEYLPKIRAADFSAHPLLWLAFCFSCGIMAAGFFVFDGRASLAICLAGALFSVVFRRRKIAPAFLSAAFVASGALLFQIETQNLPAHHLKRLYDENRIGTDDPIEVEGVLENGPELAAGGFFLRLRTEKAIYKSSEMKVSGRVRLFAPVPNEQTTAEYEALRLRNGTRVRVACRLRREESFLNPGVKRRIEILEQADIDAYAVIKSPLLVEKLGEARTFAPLGWIYDRRRDLIVRFKENFSVSTAGVLIASLLGDKYFLDRRTAETFREGGTFHVLVISGLHITFIGGLALLFIRFFTRRRIWQFIAATAFLWGFALAVGAEVPVVRAAIMFTILLFSQVVYRQGTLLNSLGASVLILLVWRPQDLFAPSFQLTLTSVAAIVAMAFPLLEKLRAVGVWSPSAETPFPPDVPVRLKRFCETLYWREAVWKRDLSRHVWSARLFKSPYLGWMEKRNLQAPARYVFEALLVSTIVQLWLTPFLIVYFHRVPIFAVFLNLWVGFWIALESFAAVIAVFFAEISAPLAYPLIKLTEFFNRLLLSVPLALAGNDRASLRIPHYSGTLEGLYFLYFLPILFFVFAVHFWRPFQISRKPGAAGLKSKFFTAPSGRRVAASVFLFLFGLIIFHPLSAPGPDGKLYLEFLDVGQGDSILITFPNGETLLVDGGGRINFNKIRVRDDLSGESELFEPDAQNIGETVVSAFLWEKGLDRVDYLLATHADADHIQGLSDVARNFKVRAALFGRTPLRDEDYAELESVLRRRGVETVKLARGDVLTFGEARIEVLFPKSSDEISDNNRSLVLRVVFGERKFLLTGDIEKETERELLEMPEFLRADVVKVPHHGSRTSSTGEFIDAVGARLAVITVGRKSPYGHPHREVLERWKNSGARVLTTGERGTISISTDGKSLETRTFLP